MRNRTPRVMVFSHNCFSNVTSNGRTLGKFFENWDKEKIAQFYIQNESPDFSFCQNYYRVTDRDALQSFLKGKRVGTVIRAQDGKAENKTGQAPAKRTRKNPVTNLIRDFVWNSRRWKNTSFSAWIDSFQPQVILLQMGDAPFMMKIALDVAKKRKIPLVLYNSESYYFKTVNYMRDSGKISSLFYPIFIGKFRRMFRKVIAYASHSIYICEMLKGQYDKMFHKPGTVLMTSTDMSPKKEGKTSNDHPVVSYLGNLGVGRLQPLAEIAEALQKIDSEIYLDVYGKLPSNENGETFINGKGIRYKGFVSYEKVLDVMRHSDLLVHAENFSDFYKEDLKFAFSTKIADSLASGTCFFLYAARGLACTEYLLRENAACVVSEKGELVSALKELLWNPKRQDYYIENAFKAVEKNHNAERNREIFRNIITQAVENVQ